MSVSGFLGAGLASKPCPTCPQRIVRYMCDNCHQLKWYHRPCLCAHCHRALVCPSCRLCGPCQSLYKKCAMCETCVCSVKCLLQRHWCHACHTIVCSSHYNVCHFCGQGYCTNCHLLQPCSGCQTLTLPCRTCILPECSAVLCVGCVQSCACCQTIRCSQHAQDHQQTCSPCGAHWRCCRNCFLHLQPKCVHCNQIVCRLQATAVYQLECDWCNTTVWRGTGKVCCECLAAVGGLSHLCSLVAAKGPECQSCHSRVFCESHKQHALCYPCRMLAENVISEYLLLPKDLVRMVMVFLGPEEPAVTFMPAFFQEAFSSG